MRVLAAAALMASTLARWPADAMTDAEFCTALGSVQDQANRDIGRQSDEVTINRGMFSLCGVRAVVFRKQITVPTTAFRAGWQDRRKAQWNEAMCAEPAWAEMIRAGWTVTVEAVFADGVRFSSQAVCS